MVSRLATQLLRLPHGESAAADMLWRYATLTDVARCRTAISESLAVELAQFLDGPSAQAFARLLPSSKLVALAFKTNPCPALRLGVAENPLTDDVVLTAVATGGAGSKEATARLSRRADLRAALARGSGVTGAVDALVASNDAAVLVDLLEEDLIRSCSLLTTLSNLEFRSLIIDALSTERADAVCHTLIGVLDASQAAEVVDDRLAEWLCTSDSLAAHADREQLLNDREASNNLLGRLDNGARRRLSGHEELWTVVQRRLRVASPTNHGPARPLDRGMLTSMRLAGMGVAEISALIFNSRIELTPDELAAELAGIDAIRLAGYFTGGNARQPRTGEIDALVAALDPFEQHRLAEAITGDIEQYPWSDELLVGIPRRFQGVVDTPQLEVLDAHLRQELDSDAKAWEVVLSMSEEWEGNLRSLTAAARQL